MLEWVIENGCWEWWLNVLSMKSNAIIARISHCLHLAPRLNQTGQNKHLEIFWAEWNGEQSRENPGNSVCAVVCRHINDNGTIRWRHASHWTHVSSFIYSSEFSLSRNSAHRVTWNTCYSRPSSTFVCKQKRELEARHCGTKNEEMHNIENIESANRNGRNPSHKLRFQWTLGFWVRRHVIIAAFNASLYKCDLMPSNPTKNAPTPTRARVCVYIWSDHFQCSNWNQILHATNNSKKTHSF